MSGGSNNRYSMPVTRSRTGFYDAAGLDQTNTTGFLFGDEEPSGLGNASGHDENFPTLVRRDDKIVSPLSFEFSLLHVASSKLGILSCLCWFDVLLQGFHSLSAAHLWSPLLCMGASVFAKPSFPFLLRLPVVSYGGRRRILLFLEPVLGYRDSSSPDPFLHLFTHPSSDCCLPCFCFVSDISCPA